MALPSTPSPDPIRAWLAAVIRGAEPGALPPDEAGLLDTARADGVLTLCHDRLRRSPRWTQYPETLREAMTRHAYQAVAVELMRAAELRDVLAALAQAGLPVLLLKGAALAYTLYPEPHLRDRCDTDLLLPSRDEAERAWRVLQTLGYQRPNAVSGDLIVHELGCYKTGHGGLPHALDIHWRLNNATLLSERFTFAELAAVAVPIPALGPHAHGLGSVHALLLACMHRVAHLPAGNGDRLIWLYDIHLLTQHLTDEQWQEWMTLAEERGVCGPCLDGLRTMQTAFETVVPDEIRGRLQAGADREGWFDPRVARKRWRLEWLNFRALPSTAARLRWLNQYLFPDADYIRRKYGLRHSLWVPWFYGVRIVQGVARRIRQGH